MDNDRKNELLDIGAKLASKHGVKNVTRRMVAQAAKVSDGLVAHYLGPAASAQKKYAQRAKKLGLPLPDKDKEAALGAKLRKKAARKTAAKPATKAVKRASATKAVKRAPENKSKGKTLKRIPAPITTARKRSVAEVKAIKDKAAGKRTAARKPKAPPTLPPPDAQALPLPPPLPPAPTN